MEKRFVILPSGMAINTNEIEYICGVNGVKLPRAKKCSSYNFSIQFIHKPNPISFSYDTKEDADADYNCLKTGLLQNG